MNLREFMNNNPAVVTIGAVVVLVICLGAIMCQLRGPARGAGGDIDVYYYDLNTDERFTAKHTLFPPIAAPSDEGTDNLSGVRAMVFACGKCGNTSSEFVAYLERYSPEAKQKLEEAAQSEDAMMEDVYEYEEQREIRTLESDTWVAANSEAGAQIYDQVGKRCEGQERAKQCFPDR